MATATKYPIKIVVSANDETRTVISRIAANLKSKLGAASAAVASGIKASMAAAGVAAVGAAYALKEFAADAVDVGDELATFSAKTGIGVEALQEWRAAAERSDVSAQAFNGGIEMFSKNLGLAHAGTGKLASGLKKMSPALLAQLRGTKSIEEALSVYIAAMERVEDPSKRAALAAAAFGGAGADMALLAATGSKALARFREEQRRAGVMSTETANKMGAVDDQLIVMRKRYEAVKLQIGATVAEAMTPYLAGLSQWIEDNRDLIAQNVADAVKATGDALASIDWEAIGNGIKATIGFLGDLRDTAREVAEAIRLLPSFGDMVGNGAADIFGLGAIEDALGTAAAAAVGKVDEKTLQRQITQATGAAREQLQQQSVDRFGYRQIAGNTPTQLGDSFKSVDNTSKLTPSAGPIFQQGATALDAARSKSVTQSLAAPILGPALGAGAADLAFFRTWRPELTVEVKTDPSTTATVKSDPKHRIKHKKGVRSVGRSAE